MPFVYVYSPSDFVLTPPDESGAAAAGTAPFALTLAIGATPTLIEITDDDAVFDEIDSGQTLTSAVNIDGTSYAAGTTVITAYDLINTTSGHQITSIHFGGDGYQQGAIDGIISTELLVPGTTYTFNAERTSHNVNNLYTNYVACFADDTLIKTTDGEVAVQNLRPGDHIETLYNGVQPLRLCLTRQVTAAELSANPKLRPIRIPQGALGGGLPHNDLLVSPQHRFLASSPIVRRMFDCEDVLISARKLTALPGIHVDDQIEQVTYHHLVFDEHQVIFAANTPTESFLPEKHALESLTPAALAEFNFFFAHVLGAAPGKTPATPIPPDARQKRLIARHAKNRRDLITAGKAAL